MSTRPYKSTSRWELDYLSKSETQAVVSEILASGRYTRHTLAAQLGITPANITHYLAGRARAPKRIKKLLPRKGKGSAKQPDGNELDAVRAAQRERNQEAIRLLEKWLAEKPAVEEDPELEELKRELDSHRTHRKLFGHDHLP